MGVGIVLQTVIYDMIRNMRYNDPYADEIITVWAYFILACVLFNIIRFNLLALY